VQTTVLAQRSGHKPLVLVGGGTTKIGDPSGKDESRQLLDDAAIQKNIEGITSVFHKVSALLPV
jgi:tyrosyl-tRNA synthetase